MSKFLERLSEMAAYFKDVGNVRTTLSDIKKQNLPHHYQKPLIAIADDADRDAMIDRIIAKVFGNDNHNPDIVTKKELQDALEKAVVDVSREPDSKFIRPVQGVAANYLGRWLGTNINVEYTRSGSTELENKGASVTAAKEVLSKTLTPTAKEKEELKQAEQPAISPVSSPTSPDASEDNKTLNDSAEASTPLDKEYQISEAMFEQFSEKISDFNKKAARKNIPQVAIEQTGEYMEDVRLKSTRDLPMKIKIIKFKMQIPQLTLPGGWKFIGRVDHEAVGNLIVSVPGSGHEEDLHRMFGKSQPSHCDHCGKTRKRTSTFVVQDEKGNIKRIGRQCLKDYLPGGEAEIMKMVNYAEFLTRIALGIAEFEYKGGGEGDDGENYGGGGGRFNHFGVAEALALTFCLVDRTGYLSKSKARAAAESGGPSETPTADIVEQAFTGELESKVNRIGLNSLEGKLKLEFDAYMEWVEDRSEKGAKKYTQKAKKAIEWGINYTAKQLADPGQNSMREFYQNLSVILNGVKEKEEAYVSKKYLGYLTSLVPLYNKHVADETANAAAKEGGEKVSEYVGTVGYPIGELNATDKRKMKKEGFESKLSQFPYNGPIPVTITMTRTIQRDSYSYYDSGVSYMYSMTDDKGNVYVYFATSDFGLNQGDKADIVKAKVKNHKDFTSKAGKTVKQTYITRADIRRAEDSPSGSKQTNESLFFEKYNKMMLE